MRDSGSQTSKTQGRELEPCSWDSSAGRAIPGPKLPKHRGVSRALGSHRRGAAVRECAIPGLKLSKHRGVSRAVQLGLISGTRNSGSQTSKTQGSEPEPSTWESSAAPGHHGTRNSGFRCRFTVLSLNGCKLPKHS